MANESLNVKPAGSCMWDAASLGEIMLRLDPGDGRIHTTREFKVWEGGGDSFASGLVYGFMTFDDAAKAVNYGAAHGALAMTTPGDTSMATKADVEKLVGGGSARVDR